MQFNQSISLDHIFDRDTVAATEERQASMRDAWAPANFCRVYTNLPGMLVLILWINSSIRPDLCRLQTADR